MSLSSSYPGSLAAHRPTAHAATTHPAGTAAGGPVKKSSVLGDVGISGGRVEDGSAWSMIARFQCSVPGCGASFTRKQNLQRHQTQKHGRPKSHARTPANDGDDYDDDDDDGELPAFF